MIDQIKNKVITSLLFFAIVLGSMLQGVFSQDYHHYGLMLSNALDLSAGKLPYKDIFIQYGFLTTLIHSLTYSVFKTMLALTCITSVFYAAGLLILKKIYSNCVPNNKLGIYFLLTCYLFHPVIFLPWSNYIAFPFLMFSILALVSNNWESSYAKFILCGFSFGLAILAREGTILAIGIIIVFFILIDLYCYKKSLKIILNQYIKIVLGIFLALVPFFLYLNENQLFYYWKIHSVDLPKVYADVVFPNMNLYKFYLRFIKESLLGIINFDIRWFLINIIVITNSIFFVKIVSSNDNFIDNKCILKLSIASIALLASMLHIPEIFRFASGGILGLVVVFSILEKKAWGIFAILFVIGGLTFTLFSGTSGINISYRFFQNQDKLKVVNIEGFNGLIWPEKSSLAYESISADLKKLQLNPCNFQHHFNATDNNFITFLSPFNKFQIAPHHFSSENYSSQKFDNLRPDLNYKEKISIGDDIVIFDYAKNKYKYNNFIMLNSYEIYGSLLGVFIPKKCLVMN